MYIIYIIRLKAAFVGGNMTVIGDALIKPITSTREIILMYLFRNQKVGVKLSEILEYTSNN